MRKFLTLFLVCVLALCLCGCNGDAQVGAVGSFDSEGNIELSEEEQRQFYYDAVEKTCSMRYLSYDASVSNVMNYPDEQVANNNTVLVKMIDVGAADSRCSASFRVGDMEFDCYYLGGYVYSNESGKMYKAPMTASEFDDYLDGQMFLAVGEEFTNIAAIRNADGTFTASLNGIDALPQALENYLYGFNGGEIKLENASGEATVSDTGYLLKQSVLLELSMTVNGEAVAVQYSADVSYENLGQKFAISIPSYEECIAVEDIEVPMLIKNAYANILSHSYNASYRSNYDYKVNGGKKAYSMDLKYNLSVSEDGESFTASDNTVIDYDTVTSEKTVKRSSEYKNGVQTNKRGKSSSKQKMTEDSARSLYSNMLMDYKPELEVIDSITVREFDSYYEIEYEYTEEGAILYCQNVLTALIEDQNGIAVHSKEHTIEGAVGTMKISKTLGTLISHEIDITASFNGGGKEFTVDFEHILSVKVV